MRTILATALALALLVQRAALGRSPAAGHAADASRPRRPQPRRKPSQPAPQAKPAAPGPVVPVEPGFTIGPEDVLGILFWRDPEMSGDVTVRPDGMITLPLVRDVKAAGLTPDAAGGPHPGGRARVHHRRLGHRRRAADEQPQGVHHRRGGASPAPIRSPRR